MKSFLPSGNVMSLALAVVDPSFARYPSTTTSVPIGSEFLFQPRRRSAFGAPHSTAHVTIFPSAPLTSMYTHECGLIHSALLTVPYNTMGWAASNSAENA